jgi:hypothetical protein
LKKVMISGIYEDPAKPSLLARVLMPNGVTRGQAACKKLVGI